MQDEHGALIQKQTWTLVSPESAPNLVGCKCVFRTKLNPDDIVDHLKAHLAAKGFHQMTRSRLHKMFSPVFELTFLRLILSLATSQNWCLRKLNINNAFLQGKLIELTYMSQPPEFIDLSFPCLQTK